MFLVGRLIAEDKFDLLYGVFDHQQDALNYLKEHHPENKQQLTILAFLEVKFPFFLIAEIRPSRFFRAITKEELQQRIAKLEGIGDFETFYFNLWRFEKATFNQDFPTESILRGRDWHLHFMDHDLQEVAATGFDQYWNSILPE